MRPKMRPQLRTNKENAEQIKENKHTEIEGLNL